MEPCKALMVGGNPWIDPRFDGVDDYVSFPNLSELDDLRPFNFSWLKLDDNGSGYVLAKRSDSCIIPPARSTGWFVKPMISNLPFGLI